MLKPFTDDPSWMAKGSGSGVNTKPLMSELTKQGQYAMRPDQTGW